MLVTLMCEEQLYEILLPEKIRGRYWIEDPDREITDPRRKILSIEGEEGIWVIDSRRKLKLFPPGQSRTVQRLELESGKMYAVELPKGRNGYIFTESYTEDRWTFKKYVVTSNSTLHIGKASENQIVIDNPYVSSVHAQLTLSNDVWTVYDNNSRNGVYINNKRLSGAAIVRPGDVLYILGVKIVFGYRFLALNNPDGNVRLKEDILKPYKPEPIQPYEAPEETEEMIYYRSPRFDREIVPMVMKIDPPTMQEREDDTSLALTLAPSLVMGTASFASGILAMRMTVQSGGSIASAVPTFIMSVSMLAGMVLFPFLMRTRERRKKREKELERQEKYLKYLGNIRAEINKEANRQQEILNENFPPAIVQMKKDGFFDMVLWSRVIGQNNFLTLRVGTGNIPLQAKLSFPDQRFAIDNDIMREAVYRFSEEQQIISKVPVVYSLIEHRVSGLVGDKQSVNGILNHLLVQIIALHSYDEVKFVFLCDESNLKKYDYVKWTPHIWDNDFRMRFLAANPEEVRDLSAYFLREIDRYREQQGKGMPHYVVISTSKALSDRCAFLAEILRDDTLSCFSYLAAYDELKNLPKECTMIFQVSNTQGMMFNYRAAGGGQVNFEQDVVTTEEAAKAVMEVSEYRLDLRGGKYDLPDLITFLDMFGVGKYEHLNVTSRWKMSNPVTSLQTPVGINSDGGLFYLDLHEEAHGPHGLIAGMTGSGKSEFIITLVLSLAVNYSPEDVAFILIDYKGGGLAGAFESEKYHLPHLAGTITNLDGAAITRSLLSIQSELKRRQKIFASARRTANEGTMDIYKYQKLYRNGIVGEPVPHLLIISDEFAELKSQQPEFMEQLISTARIGRSLGVHLILATQKPSGVVSDQIWANSRFKVSLKVQDRADSMEMLKRPDAAELVETGRFYLQVGYNELFELGQSAWCGAPYLPADISTADKDERVQMIDHQGNVIDEAKLSKGTADSGEAKKQIVEIVQYLTQIAAEEHLRAEPLWLPELPARILADELEEKYHYQSDFSLDPIIGELDDPFHQEQRLLTMPLSEKGNAVCYGSATSGKDEFLTVILYSLYRTYTSEELNTYILDFGAETLQMFEDAPQTGSFVVSGEDEKIDSLFRMLKREIVRRKKRFISAGGDYLSYRRQGNTDVPGIVVIINEYANFAEQYEKMDECMASLTRECTKYGMYFILSNLSQVGIRYKLQQNFSQIFVLQMNDKTDYVSILGNTGGVYPSRLYGRGIFRDKEVYEFQTACVTKASEDTADAIRQFCRALKESGQKKAKPIPIVPKVVYQTHLEHSAASFEHMPVGLDTGTAEPVCINLRKENVEQVLAMDRQDTIAFAEGLSNLLRVSECEFYLMDPGGLLSVEGIDQKHYAAAELSDMITELFQITVERHNLYKQSGGMLADWRPMVVFLIGLRQIRLLLDDDKNDKLKLMLEKTSGRFGMSFWVFDDYSSSNTYSIENWCKGDGIWIGNGIGDQMRLKFNRQSLPSANRYDFTNGFLVRRGSVQTIKLLASERMGKELEEEEYE